MEWYLRVGLTFLIAFFQDKKTNGILFCKCFRNHSTEDPYSGKIESTNTDGTFLENTTRRKSVSKEDLLNDDFKGSSSPGQIEYNQKTYGKLQVTLLFSV